MLQKLILKVTIGCGNKKSGFWDKSVLESFHSKVSFIHPTCVGDFDYIHEKRQNVSELSVRKSFMTYTSTYVSIRIRNTT